jgi:hypothetical protein
MDFPSSLGIIEKVVGFAMSAKLSFNLDRPRCRETVVATVVPKYWKMGTSAAAAVEIVKHRRTDAVFLRVYLTNHSLSSAKECRVFVKSVKDHAGRLLDDGRSQLAWTDQDEAGQFVGRSLERGRDRGLYADFCSSIEGLGYLQIESQLSRQGYHQFHESDCYTIELEATADWAASAWARIRVHYNKEDWQSLCFVQATGCVFPFSMLPADSGWVRNFGTKELLFKLPHTPGTAGQPEP